MAHWATATMDRRQIMLFNPTLDETIPPDHTVRLFDELLSSMDWRGWENHYILVHGQPPIHPKVMASIILYGLSNGIRSSRRLEWACGYAVDYIWLAEGRQIDHSTFCGFRTNFAEPLKDMFKQIGRLALAMGMIRLNQVALDGTRVKANNSRYSTMSAGSLEQRVAELNAQVEKMFQEAQDKDAQEKDLFGDEVSPTHLPPELADLRKRQRKLQKALEAAKAKGLEPKGRVPLTDPDSTVMPNKEGGFAPNYVPLAAADGAKGLIVEQDVVNHSDEGAKTLEMVDQIKQDFGQLPQQVLADSKHGTGENLQQLQDRQVEAYIPQEQRRDPNNPSRRDDPHQPVPQEQWPSLPRNARTGKLDRAAFVYDAKADCYFCPQGHEMPAAKEYQDRGASTTRHYRLYQCAKCEGCVLSGECRAGKGPRTVSRDQHEPLREQMDQRLASPEGKARYSRRKWIAETPFAGTKAVMGVRQFLLRGQKKVRMEWTWVCAAFNLRKMTLAVANLRGRLQAMMA